MKATPTMAAVASVCTALSLTVLKSWATIETGSVAMLGSLADAALDLVASLVTLGGVRIAAMPADHDHRFGHGKAEALAALFQMALVAGSAALIAWRAVRGFGAQAAPTDAVAGIGVSLFAMALTALLLAYQRRAIAASASLAIRADRLHYESDFLLNGAVLAALGLELVGIRGADPVFGLLIAVWLARNAWQATSLALDQLMDKEWPPDKRGRLLELANRHPALRGGVHDLRTRTAGGTDFAQFHIWVAADMSVADAHVVMDEIEETLAQEFAGIEILIHVDPEGQIDAEGVLPSSLAEETVR